MTWRKTIKPNNPNVKTAFANWLSQLCLMILSKSLYMVAGRGSAKTTDIQVNRLIEMAYDMPGAPVVWVADTYSNLQKNVLRTVEEGLKAKGFIEGIHYVKGKKPPEFSPAEIPDGLPPKIKEHFWKPYNKLSTYQHTIIFFTGLNITFGSLDRPASLAGGNYVHVFGDEAKYFREQRVLNLQKAIRGMRAKYGNSVFYRGRTFTTDMPNPDNVGEYDWILKRSEGMSAKSLILVLKCAMIVNEALQEYIAACESGDREEMTKKKRTWQRWVERWIAARMDKDAYTMFYIASSYVNVDILTPDWFHDAFTEDFIDAKTTVLSLKPTPEKGDLFYANLGERHFYMDGTNEVWGQRFGLDDEEDCRILKYHQMNQALDLGMDFGNMMSATFGQQCGEYYRIQKFIYTLSPEWIRELADKILAYYKPHRQKVINLYYDRAANNFKDAGQDLATQLMKALMKDKDGKPTGWKVILMSVGQGNIGQMEEYNFMQELFSGTHRKLPKVLIDFFHCKPLRSALQMAKTRKRTSNGKTIITKDKRSEQLPVHRLPMESTNPSDSFKYLMMRRSWRILVRGAKDIYTGTASVRG